MLRHSLRGPRPTAPGPRRESERGQLLAIFALAMVALVAMTGLIIDGGDTFLQKRDEQNVADAAAMAAGYAYINGTDMTTAARTVAAANGYTHGSGNVTVNVTITSADVTVTVTKPHRNYFSGVVGFASWNVSATATVEAGTPNAAIGAMPIIFNQKAFNNPNNKNKDTPGSFDEPGTGSQDVPQTDASFNWTVFCTHNGNPCNASSSDVDALINGGGNEGVVYLDDDIGPLNAGSHTTLFSSLAAFVGQAFPVAIVSDSGEFLGWAYFHITGSNGGDTKQISGYFDDQITKPPFTIVGGHGTAGNFGTYVVHLTN